MARKTVVTFSDDLDGSEASESLTFSLDGVQYEIDLNDDHANELRASLRRFTDAARQTSGSRARPAARKSRGSNDTKAIRLWALDQGFNVNTRGRVQANIVERYNAAH